MRQGDGLVHVCYINPHTITKVNSCFHDKFFSLRIRTRLSCDTLPLCFFFLSFKTIAYPFYINDVGPMAQARKSEDIPHKERLCKHKASVYKDASLPLPQSDIDTGLKTEPT